ncbi:hypothetical protein NG799_21270 [Laspinema sp. D1]|uniref:Uncharacterized protein n=1 Tax=Laspinema palackyanum D2a TaxID=2953684 RepID=A0ABT2MVU3_9CYAN|nr:hypothetical protein [Laspinema sp. D2b]MCT7968845.1 hypothetical protein [Laspinema sp. D2a]
MNLKNISLLTGTILSVTIGWGNVSQAIAETTPESGIIPEAIAQTMMNQPMGEPMMGRVTMIRNNIVTLEMENGETTQVALPVLEQEKLGMRPGVEVLLYPDGTVTAYTTEIESEETASSDTLDEIRRVFESINSRQETTTTITPEPRPSVTTTPTAAPQPMQPAPQRIQVETAPQQPVRALW